MMKIQVSAENKEVLMVKIRFVVPVDENKNNDDDVNHLDGVLLFFLLFIAIFFHHDDECDEV